jgi:hypothetical protein
VVPAAFGDGGGDYGHLKGAGGDPALAEGFGGQVGVVRRDWNLAGDGWDLGGRVEAEAELGGGRDQLVAVQPLGRLLHEGGVAGVGEGAGERDLAQDLVLEVAEGAAADLGLLGAVDRVAWP